MAKRVGFSSLINGMELPKSDLHFEVLGVLDECSAAMAVARSTSEDAETKEALKTMQQDLSSLMGLVAGVASTKSNFEERLVCIERTIVELKWKVSIPTGFIVPGETVSEANLDFARTVARRAERTLARFAELNLIFDPIALQYLNRVSTLLYLYELKARNLAG